MAAATKDTPDVWELASALYLHGPNVETLLAVLPRWSKEDIQTYLRKFRNRAERERMFLQRGRQVALNQRKGGLCNIKGGSVTQSLKEPGGASVRRSNNTALLSWSELVHRVHAIEGSSDRCTFGPRRSKYTPTKDHSQLLSKVMLYSACFEDHYHGGQPDDTCYSEIYRYFSQLLSGEEPTQLRPKSAAKVVQMIDRLSTMLGTATMRQRLLLLQQTNLSNIQAVQASCADGATPPAAAENNISLFEDPQETAAKGRDFQESLGEACAALDPLDPYFDEKREAVNNRLTAMQEATALSIRDVPGINPLGLPPSLLTKPLHAFPSTYPARTDNINAPVRTPRKFTFPLRRRAPASKEEESVLLDPAKVGRNFGALQ